MKRTTVAILIASLFAATQAVAAAGIVSAIPDQTSPDDGGLAPLSTYADAHASDPVTITGSAIPDQTSPDDGGLAPLSTYADAHASDPVTITGSAIPDQTTPDDGGLPARSTYADSHLDRPALASQPGQDADAAGAQ